MTRERSSGGERRRDDDERLVPIRPRSRGERRSLRTLHGGETEEREEERELRRRAFVD